jgi:hypothetical protein
MANCMMGFPNRADKASLSGGSWMAGLPRANLQDRVIGRVARTANAALASTQFNMDMGPAGKARALSMRKHNMSLAAKYRLRATSDPANTEFSLPDSYDSGWQDVWPTVYPFGTLEWGDENWWSGKYTVDETEGYIAELVHILPADRYERWWRIEFDDQGNADGYIEIGRLFIGPVWQPNINMEYGASIGWETTTEARQAISGAEYFSDGINFRVQRFTLGCMDQDEAFSQAFELQRRAGISGEILWIHDPDDTVHALRRRYLARMRQLSAIDYPYYGANSTAFELKELL